MPSRVWLITGCSSGFGREIALAALAAGDRVVATARRPEVLDDLIATDPERVLPVALDVTRDDQVAAAVSAAMARFGRVDVLVNNAGYGSVGAIEEIALDDLRELMETMFFGAVGLTQAVLPVMRAQGSGAIVQMSSMGGMLAPPGFGAYCAAKFGLEAISEALSAEVGPLGIRVLIVEPGAFRTDFGGGRMHRSPALNGYADTVGPVRAAVDEMALARQPGDPAKAATAILAALDADDPPLRLALGADAVDAIADKLRRTQAELRAWEAVSRATAVGDEAAV
jgi:NAD(P)-dependent dehydrogenase (short-subunit alcohol dehydrogenase family)